MGGDMDIRLRKQIEPGYTHEDRLAIARKIADVCLSRHGRKITTIGFYGSTVVNQDLALSDLDMTVLSHGNGDPTFYHS